MTLRTADQYHLWKARTHAACWAATRLDVFSIADDDCKQLNQNFLSAVEDKPSKDGKSAARDSRIDPIGKCWTIITSSLHDDLFLKLVHVEPGKIATLMAEIRSALMVNMAEDVQPIRLELYSANMQRDCNNDLQSFIAYIIQRRDKLQFLKYKVPEDELIHVFLKGLPAIFQPLQVHFAIPGNTPNSFDALITLTRKFAGTPIVSAELAKLKSSGLSQNIFTTISRSPNSSSNAKEKPFWDLFLWRQVPFLSLHGWSYTPAVISSQHPPRGRVFVLPFQRSHHPRMPKTSC